MLQSLCFKLCANSYIARTVPIAINVQISNTVPIAITVYWAQQIDTWQHWMYAVSAWIQDWFEICAFCAILGLKLFLVLLLTHVNLREHCTGEGIWSSICRHPCDGNTCWLPWANLLAFLWTLNLQIMAWTEINTTHSAHWRQCRRRQRCPRWHFLAGRREKCPQGIQPGSNNQI